MTRLIDWCVYASRWVGCWVVALLLVAFPAQAFAVSANVVWMAAGGHEQSIRSVAHSPDGLFLASGSADRTVRIWDATDGELPRTLTGHTNQVAAVAYSPDGQLLATGAGDHTAKVWRVSDGTLVRTFDAHYTMRTHAVAFSPDAEILAVGPSEAPWQCGGCSAFVPTDLAR